MTKIRIIAICASSVLLLVAVSVAAAAIPEVGQKAIAGGSDSLSDSHHFLFDSGTMDVAVETLDEMFDTFAAGV